MSQAELEQALRDLKQVGTLVKDRPYRQVWRFAAGGKQYFLKFYPRQGGRLKRLLRGDPAMREFVRLQWLQKAGIASPRAQAVLKGFRLDGRHGDALILEAIESAVPLDRLLHDAEMRGAPLANHRELVRQVIEIVSGLARARLGHADLHLGNFLLSNGRLYLIDAYEVRAGGLRRRDLLFLGHAAERYATRADLLRGWRALGPAGADLPPLNALAPHWRRTALRAAGANRHVASIADGGWDGRAFLSWTVPHRWSRLSQRSFAAADWLAAWNAIQEQTRSGQAHPIKDSPSASVSAVHLEIAGRPTALVVKRPRRKQWHRWATDPLRGDRASRAWTRAYELIARGIPVAWPVLVMTRRMAGYPAEACLIMERIDGTMLSKIDLQTLSADERDRLFRRVGRLLRRLDSSGFYHRDAKSDNILITPAGDAVLVDLDGVRAPTFGRWSLPRLLKSMKSHPQYTPADSLSLCRGYAPVSRAIRPEPAESDSAGGRP